MKKSDDPEEEDQAPASLSLLVAMRSITPTITPGTHDKSEIRVHFFQAMRCASQSGIWKVERLLKISIPSQPMNIAQGGVYR